MFDIALSGLAASKAAIDNASNNISNAENPYYKKQKVEFNSTSDVNGVGTGVTIAGVSSVTNDFTLNLLKDKQSEVSYDQEFSNQAGFIENYFDDLGNERFMGSIADFFNAFDDLKNNYTSTANSSQVVTSANTLISNLNEMKGNIADLRAQTELKLSSEIKEVNSTLSSISSLNKELAKGEDLALLDLRDQLERDLSEKIGISVSKNPNYTIIANDQVILRDGENYEYTFEINEGKESLMINDMVDVTNHSSPLGEVGALLEFVKEGGVLDEIEASLEAFEYTFAKEINEVYSSKLSEGIKGSEYFKDGIDQAQPLLDNPELMGIQPGEFTITYLPDNSVEAQTLTVHLDHSTSIDTLQEEISNFFSPNGDGVNSYVKMDGINSLNFEAIGGYISIDEKDTNINTQFGLNQFFIRDEMTGSYEVSKELESNPDSLYDLDSKIDSNLNMENIEKIADLKYKEVVFVNEISYENFNSTIYTGADGVACENPKYFNTVFNGEAKTFEDYYSNLTLDVSIIKNASDNKLEIGQAVLNTIENEYNEMVKVDVDEELAKLMEYQSAYQANAKVIQTINEVFDYIMQMV